jgi:hypothetical protein
LIVQFTSAQIIVNCTVQNTENEILPYATAYCINNSSGLAADTLGKLSIRVDNITDSVRFSMLGYHTTVREVRDLLENNIVLLERQIFNLTEVVISNERSSFISLLGGKTSSPILSGSPGGIILVKINNPEKAGEFISKVIAEIRQFTMIKDKNMFKLRVRLYSVGYDGFPEYDLLTETVDAQINKKDKKITADISAYNIALPASGVFAGFEWLPQEQVNTDYTKKITGPNIATTKIAKEELTLAGSISGEWEYFSMEGAPFFISKKTHNAKIGIEFK